MLTGKHNRQFVTAALRCKQCAAEPCRQSLQFWQGSFVITIQLEWPRQPQRQPASAAQLIKQLAITYTPKHVLTFPWYCCFVRDPLPAVDQAAPPQLSCPQHRY